MQTISIFNQSTVVSDKALWKVCQDIQRQVSEDFAPHWNTDARLRWGGSGWPITLKNLPSSDDPQGALGWHERDGAGKPRGFVIAEPPDNVPVPWSATLSHEILEMLANPYGNRAEVLDNSHAQNGTDIQVVLVEVCDPVQRVYYQHRGSHHSVLSDFVYPAWYDPHLSGPYDFRALALYALVPVVGGDFNRIAATSTQGWASVGAV